MVTYKEKFTCFVQTVIEWIMVELRLHINFLLPTTVQKQSAMQMESQYHHQQSYTNSFKHIRCESVNIWKKPNSWKGYEYNDGFDKDWITCRNKCSPNSQKRTAIQLHVPNYQEPITSNMVSNQTHQQKKQA